MDSAKGSLVNGRDPETQAILGIRGKILNTEKEENLDKILNEKGTIKDIVYCLGTGIAKEFDIKKLRYGKIIFCTDADVDGSHIDVLLTTLFYKHFKPLIEQGRVYIAVAPLYKLEKGKEIIYVNTDDELNKINTSGYNITRFKGNYINNN